MEVTGTSAKPKLHKNEGNAKGKLAFLFISEWQDQIQT